MWNILAVRYKTQQSLLETNSLGKDLANYTLFGDCEWNKLNRSLKEAYIRIGTKHKGYHACRHTFVTLLTGVTRSYFLVRMISGHKSQKAFERYLHIYEQIAMQSRQKLQTIEVI